MRALGASTRAYDAAQFRRLCAVKALAVVGGAFEAAAFAQKKLALRGFHEIVCQELFADYDAFVAVVRESGAAAVGVDVGGKDGGGGGGKNGGDEDGDEDGPRMTTDHLLALAAVYRREMRAAMASPARRRWPFAPWWW